MSVVLGRSYLRVNRNLLAASKHFQKLHADAVRQGERTFVCTLPRTSATARPPDGARRFIPTSMGLRSDYERTATPPRCETSNRNVWQRPERRSPDQLSPTSLRRSRVFVAAAYVDQIRSTAPLSGPCGAKRGDIAIRNDNTLLWRNQSTARQAPVPRSVRQLEPFDVHVSSHMAWPIFSQKRPLR